MTDRRPVYCVMLALVLALACLVSPFTPTVGAQDGQASSLYLPALSGGIGTPNSDTLAIAAVAAAKNELNADSTLFLFTIARGGNINSATTVDYAVTGSGAHAASPADFAGGLLPQGKLWFGPGESSRTLIVAVQGDNEVEQDEGFTVALNNPVAGTRIVTGSAISLIRNDDVTLTTDLALLATVTDKPEGNDGVSSYVFKVTRTGLTNVATTVDYTVTGDGADPATADDFTGAALPAGTLAFAAGETEKSLAIDVVVDGLVEPDQGFMVTLGNASGGAQIIVNNATGTILNDDSTDLSISLADPDKPEGDSGCTDYSFTVTREGDTSGETTVDFTIGDIEAFPADANDFCADVYGGGIPGGTFYFGPGESVYTYIVYMQGDTEIEQNEDFEIKLSNPSGAARIVGAEAIADIRNDDTLAPAVLSIDPAVSASAADGFEGNSGTTAFNFLVSRTGDASAEAKVYYLLNEDGLNPANAADFGFVSLPIVGSVTFNAGESFTILTVNILGDTTSEPDEGFSVTLESPSDGALILKGGATGIIRNDDGWTPQEEADIAAIVAAAGSVVEPTPTDTTATKELAPANDDYKYVYETHDVFEGTDTVSSLGRNDGALWPGNLIRGNTVNTYVYPELMLDRRMPISISVGSLLPSCDQSAKVVGTVDNPTLANMRQGIVDLLKTATPNCSSGPAMVDFRAQQMYSESQLNAWAKANVKYGNSKINSSFNFASTDKKTKIIAKYEQIYFSVDVNSVGKPAALFDPNRTDIPTIQATLAPGSMPLYVASVQYGMVAYIMIETNYSYDKTKAALNTVYSGGGIKADVGGGFTAENVLSNSNITILVYGGSTKGFSEGVELKGLDGFLQIIQASRTMSPTSQPVPLQYTFKNLSDNLIAKVTYTSKYTIVRPVQVRQSVGIKALKFVVDDADDGSGDSTLEIDRLNLTVAGSVRSSYYDPGTVIRNGTVHNSSTSGSWSAGDGGEITLDQPEFVVTFPKDSFYLARLAFNAMARDYDKSSGDDYAYGSRVIDQSDWFGSNSNNFTATQNVYVYGGDFDTGHFVVQIRLISEPNPPAAP